MKNTDEQLRKFPKGRGWRLYRAAALARLAALLHEAGRFADEIAELRKALSVRERAAADLGDDEFISVGYSRDQFRLAIAHWELGEKDEARTWYDGAVERMDKYDPTHTELLRFRAEAAELLGVTQPQPSTNSSDQPQSPLTSSP